MFLKPVEIVLFLGLADNEFLSCAMLYNKHEFSFFLYLDNSNLKLF